MRMLLPALAALVLLQIASTSGVAPTLVSQEECRDLLMIPCVGDECVGNWADCHQGTPPAINGCDHFHMAMSWRVPWDSGHNTGKKRSGATPEYYQMRVDACNYGNDPGPWTWDGWQR